MNQEWAATISLDITTARKLIEAQFHALAPVKEIKLLGEGWDNSVFLVNQSIVFRFPRREIAVKLMARENHVLSQLNQFKLNLHIPNPIYQGQASAEYPYPFQGYTLIYGKTAYDLLLSEDIRAKSIAALAKFLDKLHNIKPKPQAGLELENNVFDRTDFSKLRTQLTERLKQIEKLNLLSIHWDPLNLYLDSISTITLEPSRNVLIHGDLYSRHLLFKDNQLNGIIDWGDTGINNRAVDLAVIWSFYPEQYHSVFTEIYSQITQDEWDYAKFLAIYSSFTTLLYSHDVNDKRLYRESMQCLQRLAKLFLI